MRTACKKCASLKSYVTGPQASPSIICETDRLILRPTTLEDADFDFATTSDPEVSRFIGGVRTLDWHHNRIKGIIEHQRVHNFSRWSVVLKATGDRIGRCGPMYREIEGVQEVELGYAYPREYWGQGYATEAARAALDRCRRLALQRRIVAIIDPQNHASIRVAEKIGMSFERMIVWEGQPTKLFAVER